MANLMKRCPLGYHSRLPVAGLGLSVFALMGAGALCLSAAQKARHSAIKPENRVYSAEMGAVVPAQLTRERIKRIVILPQVGDVEDADGLISAIFNYLSDNSQWYVAPPDLALEIADRNQTSLSLLDAIDPNTGDVDMQRYLAQRPSLMMTITSETRTDAVLEIRVVRVRADVHNAVASWDGMTELMASRIPRTLLPWKGLGSKDWVAAASADMSLWSPDGKALWKKRRGFATLALQSGSMDKYYSRPLWEVYQDKVAMQRWLTETLADLAPLVNPVVIPQVVTEVQNPPATPVQRGEIPK